jgi:multiple sugar transport system permease protein
VSTTTTTATAAAPPRKKRAKMTDRSKAENRLGQRLVAPAVIVMLLVTAYPMFQALYLSLFRYRLTSPDDKTFIGLSNYWTVLTDSLFWQDTLNTVIIMVVTVGVELVIGFAFAMVMHRIVFARGAIRHPRALPARRRCCGRGRGGGAHSRLLP